MMNKRTLTNLISCLFLTSILSSCFLDNTSKDIDIPRPPGMEEDSATSDVIPPDDTEKKARLAQENEAKTKTVIYESCAVYAASNEYRFQDKEGKTILIMVSQLPETGKEKKVKVPDNMLEDAENIEGPPGANLKMIGREFLLIYDDNDEVIEIKLKE